MNSNISRFSRTLLFGLASVGGALLLSSAASAADTDNLLVTADVAANCDITANGLAFGTYDPVVTNLTADLDVDGSVSVICTSGTTGDISLGQGLNPGGLSSEEDPVRQMSDGGTNFLSYEIFQETGRTTNWGNTVTSDVPHIGDGTLTAITIYGRIPGAQIVPVASYSDTVVATVTF